MDKELVFMQLDRIFSHDLFKSSRRSVSFLRYVCQQKLEGGVDQIKEYSIAIDAFGLERNFDQQLNPRIRVEAKRLRDRLHQYYTTDGKKDPIIISLPKGSYVPEFNPNTSTRDDRSEVQPEEYFERLFALDCGLLKLKLGKSPTQLFDKRDYIQAELLQQLYIRSCHKGLSDYNPKDRVDALVMYSTYNHVPCFHVVMTDQYTDKNIASSVFPLSENTDILSDTKTLYQLVDFLIYHCQSAPSS